MSPRELHFVTSHQEYDAARELDDRAERGQIPDITIEDVEAKGKGTLTLWITDYQVAPSADSLDWISVKVKACWPH